MSANAVQRARLSDQPSIGSWPGVEMRPFFGDGLMVNLVSLGPDAEAPEHEHPEEQISVVLSGTFAFTIDGAAAEVKADDAVAIPGGVVHGGRAGPAGCTMLDVFHPVREDLRAAAQALDR